MSRIARSGYLVAVNEPKKRPLLRFRREEPYRTPAVRLISEFLHKQSHVTLLLMATALLAAVGALDYWTGAQLSFLPFYLLPLALVTWYVGMRAGLLFTLASSLVWTAAFVMNERVAWDDPSTYWNIGSRLLVFLFVLLTLSGMQAALTREKELARTDLVTGAANSRAFYERVEQTIFHARRYKRPFTGVYIDVDNFKAINDHFGHSTGDFCLRVVADTIRANLRVTDLPARIAGDEFAILMPETSLDQAHVVMARLREKLLEAMRQNGWPATFSIGVMTYVTPPTSADDLIKMADSLMYSVKNNGKNGIRYEVYGEPAAQTPAKPPQIEQAAS